jgi:hypothetical protein
VLWVEHYFSSSQKQHKTDGVVPPIYFGGSQAIDSSQIQRDEDAIFLCREHVPLGLE